MRVSSCPEQAEAQRQDQVRQHRPSWWWQLTLHLPGLPASPVPGCATQNHGEVTTKLQKAARDSAVLPPSGDHRATVAFPSPAAHARHRGSVSLMPPAPGQGSLARVVQWMFSLSARSTERGHGQTPSWPPPQIVVFNCRRFISHSGLMNIHSPIRSLPTRFLPARFSPQ